MKESFMDKARAWWYRQCKSTHPTNGTRCVKCWRHLGMHSSWNGNRW